MSPLSLAPDTAAGQLSLARVLGHAALALWLGGGLASLFATRAVFRHVGGKPVAGQIASEILSALSGTTALALGLLVVSWYTGLRGPGSAAWIAGGTLYLVSELFVRPTLQRMREGMGGSTENVPADDPRRRRFGALHGVSMLLLVLQLACAAAALVLFAI